MYNQDRCTIQLILRQNGAFIVYQRWVNTHQQMRRLKFPAGRERIKIDRSHGCAEIGLSVLSKMAGIAVSRKSLLRTTSCQSLLVGWSSILNKICHICSWPFTSPFLRLFLKGPELPRPSCSLHPDT